MSTTFQVDIAPLVADPQPQQPVTVDCQCYDPDGVGKGTKQCEAGVDSCSWRWTSTATYATGSEPALACEAGASGFQSASANVALTGRDGNTLLYSWNPVLAHSPP